jgi:D-alanyl-D-alanine carboxypeptidase/D-alanyl-D-alanine-endopeptidase (penicillin-binding protein 4)
MFEAVGTIAIDNTKDDSAAVHDGALYFASVFNDVLTSNGITVRGKARHERTATATQELLSHKSPKLADIIKVINLNSQNFYAECLGKTLGKLEGTGGSFAAGTDVVHKFMQEHGIFNEGEHRVDASGLSAENRVTARQLVETLRFMDAGPHKTAWRASLPQGGTRGSLKTRFQSTSETRALAPRIFGKTGLIGGVRSLTGIVTTQSGRELYYSIILNGLEDKRADDAMALIDAIAVRLARDE